MNAMVDGHLNAGPAERRTASATGAAFTGPTSGLAPGNVQANLVILPKDLAHDFLRFAQANPRPCPVLAVSEEGSPHFPGLGEDLDIRTDVPRYRVWRHVIPSRNRTILIHTWRGDLVGFALGCSFSFEEALVADGIEIRHITRNCNVPMYRTNIQCAPAGVFAGPMVVSMRPMKPADAIRAVQITSRFPSVHGAPVHLGLPRQIGILDIDKPDYGDPVPVGADELPVFWACGVTPQAVIAEVKPEFCITHAPGSMLITDLRNTRLAVL